MKRLAIFVAAAALAPAADSPRRFFATAAGAKLVEQGLAAAPPTVVAFTEVPPPGLRSVQNEAQATTAPWIDSNGWRFQRGLDKANYSKLPAGAAPLAAAEAFAFGVDAIL